MRLLLNRPDVFAHPAARHPARGARRQGRDHVSDGRDASRSGAPRASWWSTSAPALGVPPCRWASWSRPRPRRCWPTASRGRRTSSRSAPTTSPSTRWPWTAAIRGWRPQVDALHPAVLRLIERAVAARRARAVGRRLRRARPATAGRADPDRAGRGRAERSVPIIPALKARIRALSSRTAGRRRGWRSTPPTAAEVRALVERRSGEAGHEHLAHAFGWLQKIGKSLMLPVSVLPVAGILLGVGSAKFSWLPEVVSNVMAQAGGAVFGNLPLHLRDRRRAGPHRERRCGRAGGRGGLRGDARHDGRRWRRCSATSRGRSWASRRSRPASSAAS